MSVVATGQRSSCRDTTDPPHPDASDQATVAFFPIPAGRALTRTQTDTKSGLSGPIYSPTTPVRALQDRLRSFGPRHPKMTKQLRSLHESWVQAISTDGEAQRCTEPRSTATQAILTEPDPETKKCHRINPPTSNGD